MRLPRFTILQLLLVTALCGLLAGWATQAWRAGSQFRLTAAEISPDGKRLATAYDGGTIDVWDISGSRPKKVASRQMTGAYFQSLRFTDGGSLFIYQLGGRGSELVAWDIAQDRAKTVVRTPQQFLAWDVSLDGTTAVSTTFNTTGTAAAVDLWDLSTGQPKNRIKIAGSSYLHQVAIDAQATTVAAMDASNSKLYLLDAGTGQPLRDFSTISLLQGWALSRDGNHVAINEAQPTVGTSSRGEILVYQLNANVSEPQKIRPGEYSWRADLSRDGSRLVVWSPLGIEVWDVKTCQRLWQKEEGISFTPWTTNFSLLMDNWRLSANGSRLVGLAGREGIAVYDASSGTRLHLIGEFNRPLHAAMYSVAFIGWAVAWGLVARRQRLREIAAGVEWQPPIQRSPWSTTVWVLVIMLVMTLVYATLGSQALAGGFSIWRFFSGAGTILGLIFLAVVAVVAIQFVYAWLLPVSFARRQARLLTREKGRYVDFGTVHGWFLGQSTIDSEFPRHVEEVRRQMSDVLEREIVLRYPLLVIGVEHQEQFDKLHARHMPHGAISVQRWWADEVRICQETFRRYAGSPSHGLRNAIALALVRRYWRFAAPQWLGTALTGFISREDRYEADMRQSLRLLRGTAGPERLRELWDQLFSFSALAWTRLVLAKEDADELKQLSELNALANSLAAFFLLSPSGERREKFIAFVRNLGPKDDPETAFSRQFGLRPIELFDQWQTWLHEQPATPIDPPRPECASYPRRFLLPEIVNPHVPLPIRRRSVVALAATGDLSAADTLVAIVADEASPLRGDALWTLQVLTGHAGSENADQWRQWLSAAGGQAAIPAPAASAVWTQDLSFAEPVMAELAEEPAPTTATESASWLVQRLATPPWQLVVARLLWGVGGVWGIVVAASFSFYLSIPMLLPFVGVVIVIGLVTLSRAAGRLWWGLHRLPSYQIGSLFACDVVNGVCGLISGIMLRSAAVKDYLRSVGGS
ncbi:MAG TPA: WD40 repeat domain-containing protein [Pirellulaceae bacterium]|nr:WD40 repeat domain-containing protein [Pirellulaceae bacterium]